MKWEPLALMVLLLALGVWLAYGPTMRYDAREGATISKVNFGGVKGELELFKQGEVLQELRVLYPGGGTSRTWTPKQFAADFGEPALRTVTEASGNTLFRTLNVTTWWGVSIVAIGFIGQLSFSGRWLVQWFVSEKSKDSVVPESFWWFSLFGGAILFGYFAWRQDIVAVLGQTSGVVVYARNIRLLRKARRRQARAAAESGNPIAPMSQPVQPQEPSPSAVPSSFPSQISR